MVDQGSFTRCIGNLDNGDSIAESVLVGRYFARLVQLARKRLEPRLRAKLDPEDVVQSAFGSFFDRNAAGHFSFDNWESLGSLLTKITIRKCARRANELRTAKRDVHREAPNGDNLVARVIDRHPTPDEAIVFSELLESILTSVKPKYQQVVLLKLQQFSNEEISEMVGRTERTVYRILERLRDQLKKLEAEFEDA